MLGSEPGGGRSFFFFNDTATTEIYTLSLHDALPISCAAVEHELDELSIRLDDVRARRANLGEASVSASDRSEEHTSELQSRLHLVCRLLLEKKKHRTGRPRFAATPTGSARSCPTART